MLTKAKRYSKDDLIKALVVFKKGHGGRLPTREDWNKREMRPSLSTFQRRFKNLEEAFEEAKKHSSASKHEAKMTKKKGHKREKDLSKKYSQSLTIILAL